MSERFLEVIARDNGTWDVVAMGGGRLEEVLGTFPSEEEAQAWLLEESERMDDPGILRPGGGQGL